MRLPSYAGPMLALLAASPAATAELGHFGPWSPGGHMAPTYVAEAVETTSVDGSLRLRASLGATYLEGNEFVYSGDYRVSKLIWQSLAPMLRGSVSADLGHGVSVSAEGGVAMSGISHMVDYDWLRGDDTFDNWSHRSEHPDTHLAHFWTGSATIGYDLARAEDAVVRLHGGFQYTDVKWDAFGGSYVYSSGGGFRDLSGDFAAGQPAISYRQQMPELFLGVDGEQYYGKLRIGGLMRAGLVVGAIATDDHWMRNLRFTDNIYVQPAVELGLDAGYALGRNVELTLAGRFKHMFERRGDTAAYDTVLGTTQYFPNAAAASFTQLDLTAGLRARF
ncbi:omptin family outer membrane protease [uncultured Devosia sp.]|uniref:omptin family outer membrane protease n=1 Tax=uncultured Devosia sp. TaxID=211434 RepID=UPI00262B5094|nr:omptin family outer membrane protease [uncultured Devosia sp.]